MRQCPALTARLAGGAEDAESYHISRYELYCRDEIDDRAPTLLASSERAVEKGKTTGCRDKIIQNRD